MDANKAKYSTVLTKEVILALKRFAKGKGVSASYVVEQALLHSIPERYFRESGSN